MEQAERLAGDLLERKRHGDISNNFLAEVEMMIEDECGLGELLLKTLGQRKRLWGAWY